jgi:hypothetical protein
MLFHGWGRYAPRSHVPVNGQWDPAGRFAARAPPVLSSRCKESPQWRLGRRARRRRRAAKEGGEAGHRKAAKKAAREAARRGRPPSVTAKPKTKDARKPAPKPPKKAVQAAARKRVAPSKKAVKRAASRKRALKDRQKPESLRLRSAGPSFTVSDIEKSFAFYRDVLGFTLKERWEEDGASVASRNRAGG